MTQEQRLDFLLEAFSSENQEHHYRIITQNLPPRKRLRALMNVRPPLPMEEVVLRVQDVFLQEESKEKGIVTMDVIRPVQAEPRSGAEWLSKVSVWQGDITRLQVDAIVNAANSELLGCFHPNHGCIDNAIHSAAGIQLREACHAYMQERLENGMEEWEPVGNAILTEGYNLPCRYVLHTVGPMITDTVNEQHRRELQSCYQTCLETSVTHGLRTVAFCCISTGVYCFPKQEAAYIAVRTVKRFLERHPDALDRVIFDVFHDDERVLYHGLLHD